ncbi:MAG: hypothetical protein QOG46_319 [Pseudonocardiales bacterium]|jgi:hypothetical protein|nr:hypothetical protein [Pseudonocardiales bacterium]
MTVIDAINLRIDRADEHLKEIGRLAHAYEISEPYTVRSEFDLARREFVYRLRRVHDPDQRIAVVVGDLLHNLRSALNYCMGGLVPSSRAAKTQFPIFTSDPFARERPGGRYLQRDPGTRRTWRSWVKGVDPDALAIIEGLQPYHHGNRGTPTHLVILNALNNADKHRRLMAVSGGLTDVSVRAAALDGTPIADRGQSDNTLLQDGTELFRHPTEVQIHINLSARVALRYGRQNQYVGVQALPKLGTYVYGAVITPLAPYLRR